MDEETILTEARMLMKEKMAAWQRKRDIESLKEFDEWIATNGCYNRWWGNK